MIISPPMPPRDQQSPCTGDLSRHSDATDSSYDRCEGPQSNNQGTASPTAPQDVIIYPRHSRYYLDDGTVVLLVCEIPCIYSNVLTENKHRCRVFCSKSTAIFSNVTLILSGMSSVALRLKLDAQTWQLLCSLTSTKRSSLLYLISIITGMSPCAHSILVQWPQKLAIECILTLSRPPPRSGSSSYLSLLNSLSPISVNEPFLNWIITTLLTPWR